MTPAGGKINRLATILGGAGFGLGFLPLLALTFFSPGLRSEGAWGLAVFGAGVITLLLLVMAARAKKWLWLLVASQTLLLAGVLVETFSDSLLYIGT